MILAGSQSKPGFTTRLIVSPFFTVYSWRSFPSARAFPLRRRRWASAGGAVGSDASWTLIDDMVSVGCTEIVYEAGGLSDLNTTLIEPKGEKVSHLDQRRAYFIAYFINVLDEEDVAASGDFRLGGAGTWIYTWCGFEPFCT